MVAPETPKKGGARLLTILEVLTRGAELILFGTLAAMAIKAYTLFFGAVEAVK
jgi:hypothetical protein